MRCLLAGISAADLARLCMRKDRRIYRPAHSGAGVAQGLAAPFATPLIGVPCLDAVAYQISAPCVLAATDARMGEVFYAWFDTAALRRLSINKWAKRQKSALPPGFVATEAKGVGNAFALADAPPFAGTPDMPTAADYLRLAQSGRYAATGAAQVELLYVLNKNRTHRARAGGA